MTDVFRLELLLTMRSRQHWMQCPPELYSHGSSNGLVHGAADRLECARVYLINESWHESLV